MRQDSMISYYYDLQKNIEIRTGGWGLGKGTVRLASMRACRFSGFVVENRKVGTAGSH